MLSHKSTFVDQFRVGSQMPTIRATSLAIAAIFSYPEPLTRSEVVEMARDLDFNTGNEGAISFGPEELGIQGQSVRIGQKGRYAVAYHPRTNLKHYGQCAFLTVKDEQGADADSVLAEMQEMVEKLEETDLLDQIEFYEVTLEGRIRVGSEYDLSSTINSSFKEELENAHGSTGRIGAVRLTSGPVDYSDETRTYYQLLLDSEETNNPQVWVTKYVRRYDKLGDYKKGDMNSDLLAVVDAATQEADD